MNRDLIIVAISLATWGIGEGLFFFFQPLYLEELGANPVQIGDILSIVSIPWQWLTFRLDSWQTASDAGR